MKKALDHYNKHKLFQGEKAGNQISDLKQRLKEIENLKNYILQIDLYDIKYYYIRNKYISMIYNLISTFNKLNEFKYLKLSKNKIKNKEGILC